MLPLAKGGWIYWHLLPLGASWCISSQASPFEEMLLEAYTPREHLLFQSSLRMPRDVTKAEREQRVDASIKMFLAVWHVEMARCPGVDVACWGFPVDLNDVYNSGFPVLHWGLAWSSWAAFLHFKKNLQKLQLTTPSRRHFCMKRTQEMPAQSDRLGDVERDMLLRYHMVAPTRSHVLFLNVPFLGWIASQQAMSTMEFPKMRSGESRSLLTLGNFGRSISTNLMRFCESADVLWFCVASVLAQEILTQPAVLYCDEPTTGLETEQQFSSWLFGEFPGVTWSDLKTLRIALWQRLRSQCLMCAFRHFLGKKCQVIVKYMKALCRYEHRLHRLHSWAPIPWTPHVRPLRWKGKRVRRWLSSHLSINLPHKLGTRELSWWVILIHFIHHDIGLSRAFLGLPSLWSIALPHWWTHCLFWSDLEIDRILRKHWLYNAWPYNASWLCHETVPCCRII